MRFMRHNHYPQEVVEALAFGITDGVITVLAILIGVFAAGESQFVIAAAALAGGLGDAFANAAGTHVSEDIWRSKKKKFIWASTSVAFVSTVVVVIIQVLPIIFLPLQLGIAVSILIGIVILIIMGSAFEKAPKTIFKYILLGILAAIFAFAIGKIIRLLLL